MKANNGPEALLFIIPVECTCRYKFLRAECIFQLVAVKFIFCCSCNGEHRGESNFANAGKIIIDLLLFILQLLFVGKHLPLATSAYAKVLAKRLNPCT